MRASISYSEISGLLNKRLKMAISLSYLSSDEIRVKFTPHKLIGQIYADIRFYLSLSGELSLSVHSDSPGVESIISGIVTMMTTKPNAFPYLHFSTQHIKINLNRVPQLTNLLKTISLSSLNANSDGLILTMNI